MKKGFAFILFLALLLPNLVYAGDNTKRCADRYAVPVGKQWGFIDHTGKVVIPAKFDEVAYFSEGLAAVRVGSKWGGTSTKAAGS